MSIVRVALDVPLPRLFDYQADEVAESDIGCRARVPFGSGRKLGLIVAVAAASDQPTEKLKPADAILRDMPPLPADWLALCDFCSRYYQHPLGQVMAFALPPLLRRGKLPRPRKVSGGGTPAAKSLPALLPEQQVAVQAIHASGGFAAFLLHGVTGSDGDLPDQPGRDRGNAPLVETP